MKKVFKQEFEKYIGRYNMNLGCGQNYEEGWDNVDFSPASKADLRFDFRESWPIIDNCYNTVLASHVLEHFSGDDLFSIMFEIGRVLRPGGYLIGVVPYGGSSVHYANPFHKQAWTQDTPLQFSKTLYETPDCASTGASQMKPLQPWKVEYVGLTPSKGWKDKDPDLLAFATRHYMNVIDEMQFVLKVEK